MQTPLQISLAIVASGKSHKTVAQEAGISATALKSLLKGNNVTVRTIQSVVAVLDPHVDWLEVGDRVTTPTVQPKTKSE